MEPAPSVPPPKHFSHGAQTPRRRLARPPLWPQGGAKSPNTFQHKRKERLFIVFIVFHLKIQGHSELSSNSALRTQSSSSMPGTLPNDFRQNFLEVGSTMEPGSAAPRHRRTAGASQCIEKVIWPTEAASSVIARRHTEEIGRSRLERSMCKDEMT